MSKLNPLLDKLQDLVDRLQDISVKANAQYEAAQDPTRLQFINPMEHYSLEQVMCGSQRERQAMFDYRRVELEQLIEEASRRYERLLNGF